MEWENINIVMVLPMKDNGKMISKMEKAQKYGLMDKNIKDILSMAPNQVKVFLNLMMEAIMKDNSLIIKFMEQVSIISYFLGLYVWF